MINTNIIFVYFNNMTTYTTKDKYDIILDDNKNNITIKLFEKKLSHKISINNIIENYNDIKKSKLTNNDDIKILLVKSINNKNYIFNHKNNVINIIFILLEIINSKLELELDINIFSYDIIEGNNSDFLIHELNKYKKYYNNRTENYEVIPDKNPIFKLIDLDINRIKKCTFDKFDHIYNQIYKYNYISYIKEQYNDSNNNISEYINYLIQMYKSINYNVIKFNKNKYNSYTTLYFYKKGINYGKKININMKYNNNIISEIKIKGLLEIKLQLNYDKIIKINNNNYYCYDYDKIDFIFGKNVSLFTLKNITNENLCSNKIYLIKFSSPESIYTYYVYNLMYNKNKIYFKFLQKISIKKSNTFEIVMKNQFFKCFINSNNNNIYSKNTYLFNITEHTINNDIKLLKQIDIQKHDNNYQNKYIYLSLDEILN